MTALARIGAERLWTLLHSEPYVSALGTLTGNQAVEQIQAGLKAIYVSGWQIAADGNLAGEMYPDQSLYPANSVPAVRGINAALARADQIQTREGAGDTYLLVRSHRGRRRGRLTQFEYAMRFAVGHE